MARRLLAGGWILLVVAHLSLSARIPAPTVVFDEIGYLGNARAMAGGPLWQMPIAPAYSGGYSVVLAPFFAVVHSASNQWLAVRLVNAVLLACLFPLLAATLRRLFGAPPRIALAGAFVGALVPATLASGQSAIAENLVLPLVPAALLATLAATQPSRPLWQRILVGPAVAALMATHPRFSLVAVAALAALAWSGIRGHLDRRIAAINATLLIVGGGGAIALNAWLVNRRWSSVERLQGGPEAWMQLVTSLGGLRNLAATAIGQAWYLAVGSAGLALVGVALIVRRTGGWERPEVSRPTRAVLLALVGAAALVFTTSVIFFSQNQFRADHYVYGRHNDSFLPVWVAMAVAAIFDRRRFPRLAGVVAGAVALTGVSGIAITALRDPSLLDDRFAPFAVPGIARLIGDRPDTLLGRATLVGVAAGVLVTVLVVALRTSKAPRTRAMVAGVGLVALAGANLYLGVAPNTAEFAQEIYKDWKPVETISRLGVDELCIDGSAVEGRANLSYGWALDDVDIRSYSAAAGEEPTCDFTIAQLDDPSRRRAGDRVATLDHGAFYPFVGSDNGLALWVRRGPAQQRVDGLGALLPTGFPTALPRSARTAHMTPLDRPSVLRTTPGGSVSTRVRVRHDGAGAPWPDLASFALEDRVRVLARVASTQPGGPVGASTGGELPRWMLPGDSATVAVDLVAVGSDLSPLPPGDYTVQLGVAQVGRDWFASGGSANRFTLVVAD